MRSPFAVETVQYDSTVPYSPVQSHGVKYGRPEKVKTRMNKSRFDHFYDGDDGDDADHEHVFAFTVHGICSDLNAPSEDFVGHLKKAAAEGSPNSPCPAGTRNAPYGSWRAPYGSWRASYGSWRAPYGSGRVLLLRLCSKVGLLRGVVTWGVVT